MHVCVCVCVCVFSVAEIERVSGNPPPKAIIGAYRTVRYGLCRAERPQAGAGVQSVSQRESGEDGGANATRIIVHRVYCNPRTKYSFTVTIRLSINQ